MKKLSSFFQSTAGKLTFAFALLASVVAGILDSATAGLVGLALMAKAIESQGVVISYSIGASPSSFVALNNVTGFKGPGGSAAVIDITNLASVAKEKMMGLPDEGQFTLDINFDPDDTGHIALRNARGARTPIEIRVTFTDSTPSTATFAGYVLGFEFTGQVDQQVKAALTIEINGPVSWA